MLTRVVPIAQTPTSILCSYRHSCNMVSRFNNVFGTNTIEGGTLTVPCTDRQCFIRRLHRQN